MRNAGLWIAALILTLASAVYQRMTGPSYPVSGRVDLGGVAVPMRLTRNHGGPGDQPVSIRCEDPSVSGELAWRRFPTADPWQVDPLRREGDRLVGALPHQPPAGKLEYQVRLTRGESSVVFPPKPAVTRFKGAVPAAILAPHILLMFVGMLLSSRAGLGAMSRSGRTRALAVASLVTISAGGFVFGPLVQHAAFGEWWTGFPFGTDLTDNKTLIAALAWAAAVGSAFMRPARRWPIAAAAVVTLVVFAIPHSSWGSEIDWSRVPVRGG